MPSGRQTADAHGIPKVTSAASQGGNVVAKASIQAAKLAESLAIDLGQVAKSVAQLREHVHGQEFLEWGYNALAGSQDNHLRNSGSTETPSDTLGHGHAKTRVVDQLNTLNTADKEDDVWFCLNLGDDGLAALENEAFKSEALASWMRFDMCMGLIVAINGVVMALITDGILDEDQRGVLVMEHAFLTTFSAEFGFRMYARVRHDGLCLALHHLLRDRWLLFDLLILTGGIADLWIFRPLGFPGGTSSLSAVRVFRLLRIVRLLRLIRLLKELWMLVSGLLTACNILFWMLIMVSLTLAVFAILTFETIGKTAVTDEQYHKYYWGSIMRCSVTLMQIATYDSWSEVVRRDRKSVV